MIVAKTVVPNQYWILQQDNQKIGNIEASPSGFSVKINNQVQSFKSINTIKQKVAIDFEIVSNKKPQVSSNSVHGYSTSSRAFNAIYDVKHQVPLWTKEARSKSWYAAGWYQLKQGREWETVFCPKLITLQRYPYYGPFYTEEQANDQPV
jgi:uncharacterized membrane protein YfhO